MLIAVPGRHVGDDDAVTGLKALGNLHAVVGSSAEDNGDAAGLRAVIGNLENGERIARMSLHRPLDESGLGNFFHIDGTGGGKIGTRFVRLRTEKLQVNADRAVLHVGIDVDNLGRVRMILQSDGGRLINLNAAGLGFRDMDASHETRRICNAGKDGAGANLLADADGDFLEDAVHASTNEEGFFLLSAERIKGLHLRDFGLLGG